MQKETMNYVSIISKTIKEVCRKISSRSLVFPGAWIRKEVVRNLRVQTRWILESNCGEEMLQNLAGSGHPTFRCAKSLGGKTIMRQSRERDHNSLRRKYGKSWVAPPDGYLRQSAQSVRSSSGYDCRITSWSESSGETRCIRSAGKARKFLHNLLSQNCKPVKSDRETCCKNMSSDLRNSPKT